MSLPTELWYASDDRGKAKEKQLLLFERKKTFTLYYQTNCTFPYFSSKITYVVLKQSRDQRKGYLYVFY